MERFIARYGRLPTERDPDYLEMLRMSKYIIKDVPMVQPGKCANCGASKNDGRQYIDFGLQIDWYGCIYLCGFCILDIANSMGLFGILRQRVQNLTLELDQIKAQQRYGAELPDKLVQAWEEFKVYYDSVHSVRDDPTPDSTSDVDTDSPVEPASTLPSKSTTNETKPRAAKSTSSSRPQNVPSLADLIKLNQS